MPQATNVETTVRILLEAAGLPVSDEELAQYIALYPTLRAGADRLYMEEVRYEEPALLFRATAAVEETQS